MITPWTIEAVLAAYEARPNDRRLRDALCMDYEHNMSCVCTGRLTFSDCEACGLDVPPSRNVFAVGRDSALWRRIW